MTNKHFNFDNGGSVPLNTPRFFQPLLPGFSQKLSIPSAFLKHIIQKKTAKLWTYSEKIFWPVKIQGNAPNLYFGQGWKQFTEDNDLHIGYFLVFRHEEATAKIREPPKFRVTLQLRNLKGHYYMYVPVEFKRKTEITKKRQLFLKDPKSELWQVEITHSSENRTVLTRGWKEFCLSNNLRPGDDCEFQLASKENGMIILQVRIFRKSKSQRLEAIKRRPKSGWDIKDMSFWSTGRTVVQPFLSIPNAFVAASGLLQKQKATLRNQKGELFDVILRRQTRNRVMLGGWKFFVAVNKLKASDVCHFKLMSDSKDNPYFM